MTNPSDPPTIEPGAGDEIPHPDGAAPPFTQVPPPPGGEIKVQPPAPPPPPPEGGPEHIVVGGESPEVPPPPPPPEPEVPEAAPILADPAKASRESVDDAYTRASRRRALLVAEVGRIDKACVSLREIALTKGQKRKDCFGQFDPSAAFCTQTCRDPVCPDYTEQTRKARLKGLASEARDVAAEMGESKSTPDSTVVDLTNPEPVRVIG